MSERTRIARTLMKLSSGDASVPDEITAELLEEHLRREPDPGSGLAKEIISWDNPSYLVEGGTATPPVDSRWRSVFAEHRSKLDRAIAAVGRFEAPEFDREAFGTGWLVREDVIATAAHLADNFQNRLAQGSLSLRIDFVAQHGTVESREHRVLGLLFSSPKIDLAFLRIEPARDLPCPIELADTVAGVEAPVCLIGYPSENTERYPSARIEAMFARIFDVKRVSPGSLRGLVKHRLEHDCTSLGGSSGSVLLDLVTGKAVGLHFSGDFNRANLAVPAPVIRSHLNALDR